MTGVQTCALPILNSTLLRGCRHIPPALARARAGRPWPLDARLFADVLERAHHPDRRLDRYTAGKTTNGRRTLDIGDATAKRLRGLDLDGTYKAAAKAPGETEKGLHTKYQHLNPGMQRMNLGNRMRTAAKESK